uniref:Uncharacterized protein n=1 Tax=Pararge aegeria TaxID=116150 RepID=S4NLF1_9NEOP
MDWKSQFQHENHIWNALPASRVNFIRESVHGLVSFIGILLENLTQYYGHLFWVYLFILCALFRIIQSGIDVITI